MSKANSVVAAESEKAETGEFGVNAAFAKTLYPHLRKTAPSPSQFDADITKVTTAMLTNTMERDDRNSIEERLGRVVEAAWVAGVSRLTTAAGRTGCSEDADFIKGVSIASLADVRAVTRAGRQSRWLTQTSSLHQRKCRAFPMVFALEERARIGMKSLSKKSSTPKVVNVTPAGQDHQVVSVVGGFRHTHRRKPCANCPWRVDATGEFPAEAFRVSAHTAYDMSDRTFACHEAGAKKPATCAGFLLRGADHNLAVRLAYMRGEIDSASVTDGGHELHSSYRAMAIANGVDPNDPVLKPCRESYFEADQLQQKEEAAVAVIEAKTAVGPKLPQDSYRWNRAILGSFKKGIAAHQAGLPIEACPYGDKRKPDGRLSWSRSFISAWRDGWRWSANGKA